MVEVDGGTHSTEVEAASDDCRTRELQRLGYRVYRAHNVDIYENVDGVLETLLALLEQGVP